MLDVGSYSLEGLLLEHVGWIFWLLHLKLLGRNKVVRRSGYVDPHSSSWSWLLAQAMPYVVSVTLSMEVLHGIGWGCCSGIDIQLPRCSGEGDINCLNKNYCLPHCNTPAD